MLISCGTKKQVPEKTASNGVTSKNEPQILKDSETFRLTDISSDKTYGFSPDNPVEVGGAKYSEGPLNERRYLNALSGPNGEQIAYHRAGSCCPVNSKNGIMGKAILDIYLVYWENSSDTLSIYINMYDSGKLKAPYGFKIKE